MSEGPYISVIGAGQASDDEAAAAEEIGRRLAEAGAVLVCGGLGGVMDAAAKGCGAAGGTSIGILPEDDRAHGSPHLTIRVATGLGEARNAIVARAADAVIAIGGEFGTLSEIALALKMGKPVVGLGTWSLDLEGLPGDPLQRAADPAEAVSRALEAAERAGGPPVVGGASYG
ncbi:MAG: TIGR00725 family protein [Actinomycetota bacterium]